MFTAAINLFQFLIGSMKDLCPYLYRLPDRVSIPYRFNESDLATVPSLLKQCFNSL